MKIAITGGTGFVGRHLAHALVKAGHQVVLIARGVDQRDEDIRQLKRAIFIPVGIGKEEDLVQAFAGCEGVAHCAGINREIGLQTYQQVHVEGTRHVVKAARHSGVKKVLLLSFLRARPNCGSPYHESKWAAEEIVRASGLDYTVIKAGMIYGRGDHMLDHLSHTLHTLPLFASVGINEKPIRPVAIEDVVSIIQASLVEGRLSRQTVAVMGPEEMKFSETVRRVARVLGKRVYTFPMPVLFHYLLAWWCELTMIIPLISLAQVRMLSEGITEPLPICDSLPDDLLPKTLLTDAQIRRGLPEGGSFSLRDCRYWTWLTRN
jgi:NADH dehydrogenase